MRGLAVLAVAAVLGGVAFAAEPSRRETAARAAPLFRNLRSPLRPQASRPGGRVYVVVTVLTPARRGALEAAGLSIEVPAPGAPAPAWPGGEVVQGVASAAARRAIAGLPFVLRLEAPGEPRANIGAVTTAGDALLGSAEARVVLGRDGAGVTVGVISDGADDRAASVASGDLPPDVELPAIAGVSPGSGDEGTALLEIVHDIAPGADLLFVAPRTSVEMLLAIDGLAAAGAQVIVDDLVFTDEPKFEDGPIAVAARRFVTGGGVYVTAAGNYARAHYFATYRPRGGGAFAGTQYAALHAFAGDDVGDTLTIPPGVEMLVVLQWNDRFGAAGNDFDLVLAQPTSGDDRVLAASTDTQDGRGSPIEAIRYRNTTRQPVNAYLAVGEFRRLTSAGSLRLDLRIFSSISVPQEYVVARESIFGHAAVEEVLSVAAAPAASPDTIEEFSSTGPATLFFPSQTTRQVPRLTAVDAVETAVGRRGSFSNPFRGTSAAAPHVAGCVALLLAAGVPASSVTSAMLTTAVDLLEVGFDARAGAGRLDCATAARLVTGQLQPPSVANVTARFDATGAVVVAASGDDPDGDARTLVVRLLDVSGTALASHSDALASGSHFSTTMVLRAVALARARLVAVQAVDAARLAGAELTAPLVCPGDESLGEAFCRVGDLLERLGSGGAPTRLVRLASSAASALGRAGAASGTGRPRRTRRALHAATVRMNRLVRLARRMDLVPELRDVVVDEASALRTRLRVLRRR